MVDGGRRPEQIIDAPPAPTRQIDVGREIGTDDILQESPDLVRGAGSAALSGDAPGAEAPDMTRPVPHGYRGSSWQSPREAPIDGPPPRKDGQPLDADDKALFEAPLPPPMSAPDEVGRHSSELRRGMPIAGEKPPREQLEGADMLPPDEPPRELPGAAGEPGGREIGPRLRGVSADVSVRVEIDGRIIEADVTVPAYEDRILSTQKMTVVGDAADVDAHTYNYVQATSDRMWRDGVGEGSVILAVHCAPDKPSSIANPPDDDPRLYNLRDNNVLDPDGILGMMPRDAGIDALADAISGGDDNFGNVVERALTKACSILAVGKMNQATDRPEMVLPPLGQLKDAVRVMMGNARTGTAPGIPNDVPNLTLEQVDEIKTLIGDTELDSIKPHLPTIYEWLTKHSVDIPATEEPGLEMVPVKHDDRVPGAATVVNSTVRGSGRTFRAMSRIQTNFALKAIESGITEGRIRAVVVTDIDVVADPDQFAGQLDALCKSRNIPLVQTISKLTTDTAALTARGDWTICSREPADLGVVSGALGEKIRHDITSTGGALHGATTAGVHGGDGYTHEKAKDNPETATTSATFDDTASSTADWNQGVTIGLGPKFRTVDMKLSPGQAMIIKPGDDVGFVYNLETRQFSGYRPPLPPQPLNFLKQVLEIAQTERDMREAGLAGARQAGLGGGAQPGNQSVGGHPNPGMAIEGAKVKLPAVPEGGARSQAPARSVHDRPAQLSKPELSPPGQEFTRHAMAYGKQFGRSILDGRVPSATRVHFLQWLYDKYTADLAEGRTQAQYFALYANRRGAGDWVLKHGLQAGVTTENDLYRLRQHREAQARARR